MSAHVPPAEPMAEPMAGPPPGGGRGPARWARIWARHKLGLNSVLAVWAFYFLLHTARMLAAGAEHQWEMILRRAAVVALGIVLCTLLYLALQRLDRARMAVRLSVAFAASLPVAVLHAAFNYYVFYVYEPLTYFQDKSMHVVEAHFGSLANIASSAIDLYFFIAAWAVLYIALSNESQARAAEQLAVQYRAEAQAAQLRALRYQLNPHFLFNALNSLSALVMRQSGEAAEQMIANLAAFLRATLALDPEGDVALADELQAQLLYLRIEQVRFPERLRVQVDVPADLQAALLPPLLLQPLVENAVKYGVAGVQRAVTLCLRARRDGEMLRIDVEDDGPGVALPGAQPGQGVGLRNVHNRLAARFGGQASCAAGPGPQGGFAVTIRLPLRFATSA